MSKMPAKKKSCFQITSVTQAQVAASSATDDTESLDEPDESRTEDVSSEIFDVSRVDYEPVCDRSSSEETLNNVDPEAPGFMALQHIPQVVQLSAMPCAPNGGFRKVGVARSTHGGQQALETGASTSLPLITQSGVVQQPAPAASGGATNVSVSTSQPIVTSSTPSSTTSTASCSSRFRVIKLDHGTGEPFRRGRWTCMEFYEKDSEGSVSRTVDSIRHANALDPSADRDSGLGLTGGSVVAPSTLSGHGLDSVADAALTAPHVHPVETLQQQQLHHQSYGVGQQAVTGTTMQNAFSNNKTMTGPTQQPVAQPAAPQNLLPVGHNGLPQGGIHIQKSPSMPPAAQAQPLSYPPQQQQQHIIQQLPLGHHHLPNQSSGVPQNQADYYQQHQPVMQAVASTGQTLPVTSLCVGQPVGQGPSQVMTAAAGGALMLGHVGEMAGVVGGSLPVSQPAPGLLQQTAGGMGGVGVSMLGGGLQQQPVGQYAPSGQQPQLHSLHSAPSSGVQNVPAVAVSTGIASVPTTVPAAMPSASSAAHAMPNLNPPSLLPVQQAQMPRNGGAPGSLGGVQGLSTAGFGQVEESMRKATEGLASQPPVFSGKDLMKPFIPESLQLASPSVNSLFGITIPIDGDEDRNPSMAFYQAFQSGSRLRDSKAHSDSASGASVVAIDNKIEQAMDLVKSHLMYAVREEVEVLKEQIKELFERNSMLERENAVLKSLANSDQLSQLSVQPAASNSCSTPPQQMVSQPQPQSQLPALALPQAQPQPQVQPQSQSQPQLQPQAQHLQPQPQPQIDPSQPPQQPPPNVTSA